VLAKWTESLLAADSNLVSIEGEDAKHIDMGGWTPDFDEPDLGASSTISFAGQDQETGANCINFDQDALQHLDTGAHNITANVDGFVDLDLTSFSGIDEANVIDPMTIQWPDSPGISQ